LSQIKTALKVHAFTKTALTAWTTPEFILSLQPQRHGTAQRLLAVRIA
jgi:hypothetical protein